MTDFEESLKYEILYAEKEVLMAAQRLAFIRRHEPKLREIGVAPNAYGETVAFFSCSHDQAIQLIKAFPTKYEKMFSGENLEYNGQSEGFSIKITSEPPQHCQIEEYEQEVPEKVVAAHVIKKKRMICPDSKIEKESLQVGMFEVAS